MSPTNLMKLLFAIVLVCVAAGQDYNSSEPELLNETKNMDINEQTLLPEPLTSKPLFVSILSAFYSRLCMHG